MLTKLNKFAKDNKLFLFVLLIASALRFVAITEVPPSLNWDEVSHGYNAYSILKTGKDEWGIAFPMIFRAYGDYKLPVYIYLTAVSEFFFGLNPFAVRLPSAFAGIGTVVFTYLLVGELFYKKFDKTQIANQKLLAAVSSLLVALEPWSLFLSRGAFEANLALFFIVAGVYFFLKGVSNAFSYTLPTTFFLGLSVWTYNSARIFVPLLMVVLFFVYKRRFLTIFRNEPRLTIYYLLLTILFFLPMFYQLLNPVGQARYGKVAIVDDGAVAQIIEARNNSSLNPFLSRLVYNRLTYFLLKFVQNWFSHFTSSFLFFKGGTNFQFSVPGYGLLYLVNLPFFFLGLILLLRKTLKKDRVSLFLLSWLLLATIPSSLTRESPHVLRSIVMLPIPMIITGYGIVSIANLFNTRLKSVITMVYIVLTILSLENYLNNYFVDYKRDYSWSWQYGYKQIVDYAKQNYDDYDNIIITKKYGEPHEFFLFYWPWDPERYRRDPNLIRFNQSNWYWVDRFDKFYFVNDWDIPREEWQDFVLESGVHVNCQRGIVNCLLMTSPGNVPKGWSKLETVNFLDGSPAFEIYEN